MAHIENSELLQKRLNSLELSQDERSLQFGENQEYVDAERERIQEYFSNIEIGDDLDDVILSIPIFQGLYEQSGRPVEVQAEVISMYLEAYIHFIRNLRAADIDYSSWRFMQDLNVYYNHQIHLGCGAYLASTVGLRLFEKGVVMDQEDYGAVHNAISQKYICTGQPQKNMSRERGIPLYDFTVRTSDGIGTFVADPTELNSLQTRFRELLGKGGFSSQYGIEVLSNMLAVQNEYILDRSFFRFEPEVNRIEGVISDLGGILEQAEILKIISRIL